MVKVLNVRCHIGAQIGAKVYNTLEAKEFDMWEDETKEVIRVKDKKTGRLFTVAMGANTSAWEVDAQSFESERPRKPGRPKASE